MISNFIKKQQKQKMESNWFKQQKNLKKDTIKELIQHEKDLQQEIIQKQILLEKQLKVEQAVSHEKQIQLKLENEGEKIINYANNIQLQKQQIESLLQINNQLQQEKLLQLDKIMQHQQQLQQGQQKLQVNQDKIKQLEQKIIKQEEQLQLQQGQLQKEQQKQQVNQDKIKQLEHLLNNKDTQNIIGFTENSLTIKNIPTVYLIYQYLYKNNVKVTGFGDFIRGCFYMLQFSEQYKINIDFNIFKHPLKQYLHYFSCKKDIDEDISNNITFFQDENHKYYKSSNNIIYYRYYDIDNILLKFIKQTKEYNKDKYLYLINHPDETKISENHKEKIRELIKPTQYLLNQIETCIYNLKLIKHKYRIIHVRIHDDCFYENNTSIKNKNKHVIDIINHINAIKQQTNDDILLIASNNKIKSEIINIIPDIKTIFHEITHTADISITNDNNFINTLKEFYVMSFSSHIYSYSVYDHGSGFSKWCSVAYNIPYVCFSLE